MTQPSGTLALPPELDPRGPRRGSGRPRAAGGPRRLWTIVAAGAAGAVLVVSTLGWFALESIDSRLQRQDVGITGPTSDIADEAQNILLVGSDNRQGLTAKQIKKLHVGKASAENGAGQRTDTMILMHLSKERDQVTLVSLPRDSYVRIPSWTDSSGKTHAASSNKLNAAYAYGGPTLMIKTIEQNTGVHIDHYVEVNFLGFVSMVDALGGVPVCVKKSIHDQASGLDLPKGRTKLDGAQALAFVRARHFDPRADIGRIERQQQFLGSMFHTAISGEVLLSPSKLSGFLDAALKSVVVDDRVSRDDMVALASRMQQVASGNVDFMTVPIADYDYRDGVHGSSVRWDRAAADELFSKLENDQEVVPVADGAGSGKSTATVPPGQVSVQVLNGAGITGLARRAADDLAAVGFAISGQPGNAATSGATTTIIAYDPRYDESVKTLSAALPGAQLKAVPGQGATMQVILGSDYTKAVTPTVSSAKPAKSSAKVTTASTATKCH